MQMAMGAELQLHLERVRAEALEAKAAFLDLDLASHWLYKTIHVVGCDGEHVMLCGRQGEDVYPRISLVPRGAARCTTCFDDKVLERHREKAAEAFFEGTL